MAYKHLLVHVDASGHASAGVGGPRASANTRKVLRSMTIPLLVSR